MIDEFLCGGMLDVCAWVCSVRHGSLGGFALWADGMGANAH